jgi:hypothetical protein
VGQVTLAGEGQDLEGGHFGGEGQFGQGGGIGHFWHGGGKLQEHFGHGGQNLSGSGRRSQEPF